MKRIILLIVMLALVIKPVYATEFEAPAAPDGAQKYMPEANESFAEGVWHIISCSLADLQPNIVQGVKVSLSLIAISLLLCVISKLNQSSKHVLSLVGVVALSMTIFYSAGSLVRLGTETVTEVCNYSKLLVPVLAGATAAQGATTSAASMYTATSVLTSVLSSILTKVTVPLIYIYLIICVADGVTTVRPFKGLKGLIKWASTWSVKLILYVFTGYLGITGVVSGAVDAATMKATKLTISGSVPVVGNILADASEAIIVSAGIMKNAAGVYGVWTVLAICLGPFLEIGIHYLLLKISAAICDMFADKPMSDLLHDFVGTMGLVLGMTGTSCILLLIGIVSFIRSVG